MKPSLIKMDLGKPTVAWFVCVQAPKVGTGPNGP